jgi:sugar lactone lactonase YvrE
MRKQSNFDPVRRLARLFAETRRRAVSLCVVIFFTASLASIARAQTQATSIPLMLPAATAFDTTGNLYFVEVQNQVVRKVTSDGVITTVAGNGVQGFSGDGGLATAASLDSPAGLAIDAAGNLYIADTHNNRIRKVSSATGIISTIAGTGAAGFFGDGAAATAAQLDLPTALALDATGDLYIADTANHRIRRIAASGGAIATVAGNGVEAFAGDNSAATSASIDTPNGLALDAAGNLYIADTHNGRIREVSATTGLITTVAGSGVVGGNVQSYSGDGGAATSAGLALPRGITIDSAGNLYIADSANHRIRRISSAGIITTVAGQGTQAFAGDNAAAAAASLDSPRAVALSPAGLLTLADSSNQRVRQLDASAPPGIHTIAGLGTTSSSETLALSGSSVVDYGSGTITATLTASTNATGSVTFLDTSGGTQTTLGTSSLSAGVATFSLSTLAAGAHSIVATYAGDATHGAAQSSAFGLTITPLTVSAVANAATVFYGQSIPTLTGSLSGVLPQDTGKVTAVFTSSAATLSSVGLYPIFATSLIGSAANDYTLAATTSTTGVNLSVTQAPSQTGLTASSNSLGVGLPFTLAVQATSTTSGTPTGNVALMDGSTLLATLTLSSGTATYTTVSLAQGTHNLSANYLGDTNFLPSSSATAEVAIGAASDFTLTATSATSQSIPQGSSATYNFSVSTVGAALSSPITLAVNGLPTGATASINPTFIPPGGAVTSFTMTIQTPLSAMNRTRPFPTGTLFAILLLPAIGLARRSRSLKSTRSLLLVLFAVTSCLLFATLASGCGNRVNTASEAVNSTSYTLTVTGTATGPTGSALQHSTVVTLQVLQ